MGLSQEMASQPTRRVLPPKPKKTQESTITEHRLLPKKSETSLTMWDEMMNPFFDYEVNTPPMEEEFPVPGVMEEAFVEAFDPEPLQDISEVDTEPLVITAANEEVEELWGDLAVSLAEAEGKDVVIEEIMLPVHVEQTNMLINPESESEYLMTWKEQDLLGDSIKQSGIDFSFENFDFTNVVCLAPATLPAPIPTTSLMKQMTSSMPQDEPDVLSSTINLSELLGLSPSASLEETMEAESDPNDPDWCLPSTSSARHPAPACRPPVYALKTPAYARKTVLHSVQKQEMKKKKPGRPERQEPYYITEAPSRRENGYTPPEVIQGQKYRRMRDLNNRASKECRARRKNKQQLFEMELVEEQEKNAGLKRKLVQMEKEFAYYQKMTSQN